MTGPFPRSAGVQDRRLLSKMKSSTLAVLDGTGRSVLRDRDLGPSVTGGPFVTRADLVVISPLVIRCHPSLRNTSTAIELEGGLTASAHRPNVLVVALAGRPLRRSLPALTRLTHSGQRPHDPLLPSASTSQTPWDALLARFDASPRVARTALTRSRLASNCLSSKCPSSSTPIH